MKNVEDVYPLSPTQQGMLFHSLSEEAEAGTYTGHITYDLHGRLDVEAFERAWQRAVDRQAVLRTAFLWEGLDQPLQVVRQKVKIPFEQQDWRGLPPKVQEKWLTAFLKADRERGFDPKQAPLLRVAIIHMTEEAWKMVWSFHLMMVDGWSLPLLFNEVVALYDAFSHGRELTLPQPRPFRDYIAWLQRQDLEQAEDYWRSALQGFRSPTSFGVDRAADDGAGGDLAESQVQLTAERTESLSALARRLHVTFNTLVQGAWALLLSRYSGEDDVVFGATVSGRPPDLDGVEDMIGLFINTLPVRVKLPPDRAVDSWLKELQAQQAEQRQYEYSPLVEIQKWSEVAPGRPLFESILVFENYPAVDRGLDGDGTDGANGRSSGVRLGEMGVAERTNYPLALAAEMVPELVLRVNYDQARFDSPTVIRLLGHLKTLCEGMDDAPAGSLASLPLLTAGERHQVASEWSDTASPPELRPVVELVADQARRHPETAAVADSGGALSYAELHRRSSRLARFLNAAGVEPGARVGLCLERSADVAVGILGIWKARGVYVPLDPGYPGERLTFMREDSGMTVVLTHSQLAANLGTWPVRLVLLDDPELAATSEEPFCLPAELDDLAYLIYTSGSSGRPKAVRVDQRNLIHTLAAAERRFGFAASSRMPHLASFSFDISLFELLNPLLAGGTSVIVPRDEMLELPRLLGHLESATHLHAVPSLMRQIVTAVKEPKPAAPETRVGPLLRRVFVGGDLVPPGLLDEMRVAFPEAAIFVFYGPTEATIICTAYPVPDGPASGHLIGRPLDGVVVRLLDRHLRPVPIGLPAEIHLGGGGVARGYLGLPELTAEKFVDLPEGRFYRTGDLARFTPDGTLEFLGRADEQVKVRGYRIELGEVASVLAAHPGVAEVAVDVSASEGEKRLVAYVVPERGKTATAGELRRFAQGQLPDFMVPAFYVLLDQLPLGPTGKLDRRALPPPDGAKTAALATAYEAPRTRNEQILASLFAEVFGRQEIGIHDNFFDLGGDSLVALKVVGKASRLGLSIPPRLLVENPTIARLAAKVTSVSKVRVERGLVKGAVPLTPIQQRFFERAPRNPNHFNLANLLTVRRPLNLLLAEKILRQVMAHHDALRLRFERDGTGWKQTNLLPEDRVPIVMIDLGALPEDLHSPLITELASLLQRSLDITRGPLLRLGLFELGSGRHGRLILILHHLAADLLSAHVLREDLGLAFEAASRGEAIVLPPKMTSFKYWAERLVQKVESGAYDEDLAYWLAEERADVSRLPVDFPGGGNAEGKSQGLVVSVGAERARALLWEAPKAYRMQVQDILLAALALATARWTGGQRMVVALEGHGREQLFEDVDVSRTVGWFTAIYPVILDVGKSRAPGQVLKSIKEQLRAVPHHGVSYGMLRYLGKDPERAAAFHRLPPAEIAFNYRGGSTAGARNAAGQGGPAGGTATFARAPEVAGDEIDPRFERAYLFGLDTFQADGELRVACSYGTEVHRQETVEAFLALYIETLGELIDHCTLPDVGGCTPSDFPLAAVTQGQLDALVGNGRHVEDIYPLAPLQEGMLFHALLAPEAGMYINQTSAELVGELNLTLFHMAWQEVLGRHPVLRTAFVFEELRQPLQIVWRTATMPIEVLDWSDRSDDEVERGLESYLREDRRRGFDLGQPPLMRVTLMKREPGLHQVVWSCHHILVDGESQSRIFEEVGALFETLRAGRQPRLEVPRPFRDYIAWWLAQDTAKAAEFWRETLSGAPGPTPLLLRPAGGESPGVRERQLTFTDAERAAMVAFARRVQVTLNTLMQGAWTLLLSRYTGATDVIYGLTVFGRPPELEGSEAMIGMFINTLPVRMDVPAEESLGLWLRRLQQRHLAMREFEYTPLTDIRRWANLPSNQDLFHNMLVSQGAPDTPGDEGPPEGPPAAAPSLTVRNQRTRSRTNVPLAALVLPGQSLSLVYESGRYEAVDIERALRHWNAVLTGFVRDGEGQPIVSFGLLSAAERQQLLVEWNDTRRAHPRSGLFGLFAAQAAARPAAPALVFGEREWSYGELHRESLRAGARLREMGVGPDVRVGVCMERSPEMIVAMLGALAAGGAYVPLDPGFPPERLAFMARDASVAVVLTSGAVPEGLPGLHCPLLALDDLLGGGVEDAGWAGVEVPAEALAYVIYTSGSTGEPKGIGIPQGAVCRLVLGSDFLPFGSGQRIGHASNVAFDAATFEIWGALLHGGVVVGISREVALEPAALASALRAGEVTSLFLTTALFNQIGREAPEAFAGLEDLLFGGELVDPKQVKDLLSGAGRPGRLQHVYGPTESTTFSTQGVVERVGEGEWTVPIGRPLSNTTAYGLDAWGAPAPLGAEGELWLGGGGLARGYVGQAGQTAERFVPDPFGEPGARLYRTGDRVRRRADGRLEFLGRVDAQVKLRGFRIEPGEIEAVLLRQPEVREAVVAVREDRPGDRRLVGYFVGEPEMEGGDGRRLRERLSAILPEYMVPQALVRLEKLPLTPNGKVDRRALPAPEWDGLEPGELAPPRTVLEEVLVGLWSDVLGVPRLGIHDDFFALGGHSLLATRLISRVRAAFQVDLPLRELFEAPTVAGLARRLESARRQGLGLEAPPLVPVDRSGPLPLSFAQQRLWFLQQLDPASTVYNILMPLKVSGPLDLDLLDRSLSGVVGRHEALRTSFGLDALGEPEQRIAAPGRFHFDRIDLTRLPAAARGAELRRLVAGESRRPFDLLRGPVLRGQAVHLGPEEHGVLFTLHHVATDGWSMEVLMREIVELYRAG
ncbi:MAG: hypothetical protein QOJ16_3228, partial [Acidobacteriota bacterium]|nr:hypothetical protein [Acidobacteriota bacterium]